MSTVTWGGRSRGWSYPTSWRAATTPGFSDVAHFAAFDAGIASVTAATAIGGVTLAAHSRATIQLHDTLTVLDRFMASGGTIELDAGAAIAGGTVDFTGAAIVAHGGLIDGSVWVGDLGRGLTVTAATIAATEAARAGALLTVAGTLGLAGGVYDDFALSLDGFAATSADELDVTNGDLVVFGEAARLVLSQDDPTHAPGSNPGGPAPVIGGLGTIVNQGLILSDARSATIEASAFVNIGSIVLDNATVIGESQYFLGAGVLSWTATIAPKLTVTNTDFENDGAITGAGATLDVFGGRFVNAGLIDLGHAAGRGPVLLPRPYVGGLHLLSTIDIAADVTTFSNTGTISADLIRLEGSVSLRDLGTLHGKVVFSGTLDLGGGTLDASLLTPGTTYVIAGAVTDGTIIDESGRIDVAAADLHAVSVFHEQPRTVRDVLGPGTVVLSASTGELAYTTAATVHGLTVRAGAHGLAGRIAVLAGSVTFAADTLISDTVAGTSLTITGGVFVENGRLELDGSNLRIATLDGAGIITLRHNAILTIDSIAATAAITVVFADGANAMVLPGDGSGLGDLGIRVTGLGAGDVIDFTGVSADPGTVFAEAGAGIVDGALLVQGASGDQASIAVDSPNLLFTAATDPNGGTILTVACFRHGARIATPSGDRPVEQLRIGDAVLTHGHGTRTIKWLGRRAYPAALVRRQKQLRPVRLAAGSLGAGLPRRALDLSPLHAVLLDGVLAPVAALVNGRTITRAPVADTAYIHIELDEADILLAEGAACESFVDCDSRAMFDNAAEYARLYPSDPPRRWSFPVRRIDEGWELEAIRRRLAGQPDIAIAPGRLQGHIDVLGPERLEGWALDAAHPDQPIEFEVIAAGRQLGCLIANRYRIDLDRAGKGRGACGFTAALPRLDAAALASFALVRMDDGARLTA